MNSFSLLIPSFLTLGIGIKFIPKKNFECLKLTDFYLFILIFSETSTFNRAFHAFKY